MTYGLNANFSQVSEKYFQWNNSTPINGVHMFATHMIAIFTFTCNYEVLASFAEFTCVTVNRDISRSNIYEIIPKSLFTQKITLIALVI